MFIGREQWGSVFSNRSLALRRATALVVLSLMATASLLCLGGCGEQGESAGPSGGGITARELVEPGALMGPGPSNLGWSPLGAKLTYVEPAGKSQVLKCYDASTGNTSTLLDPEKHEDNIDVTTAQWSPRGDLILLSGDTSLWLLTLESGKLRSLAKGDAKTSIMFSPDGKNISYVQSNDLYAVGTGGGGATRLTPDGSEAVYNGCLDWVYTEELATRDAQPGYAWSPDGKRLMYLRLDDSKVQQHPVTDYVPVPPETSYTRYPAAGTANPEATLHVLTPGGKSGAQAVDLPEDTGYILPFFTWTPDATEALFITVNRDQTVLQLNAWNPSEESCRTVIRETDPKWINENYYVAPVFIGDGRRFLWLSERDGFMHLYLHSLQGNMIKQLTSGSWLIDTLAYDIMTPGKPVQVDPSGSFAYFTATKDGPLERQVYRLDIRSGKLGRISKKAGFHSVALSGDGAHIVDQFSNVNTPPVTSVSNADGTGSIKIAGCTGPSLDLPDVKREFVTVEGDGGVKLEAQIVKPENFDKNKKYGVVIHWYGGPGLQLVSNRYGATNIFNIIERDVLYTQQGFIVWRLDNRGSFGRGHGFETPIDGHLGPVALKDQLAGVEYLKSLPYVDEGRIGTDGKSFGGFLTLYALIHKPDVFKCGVAGSGPTDWTYYDTVYTERYMETPEQNPYGYTETDLASGAGDIKAKPLIIHGLADTNVHLQNSVNFIQALEHADKLFDFIPLPNEDHHYEGDGLATALSESVEYFAEHMGSQ